MYKWRTNTKELILKHFKGNWGNILVLNKQTCMFIYHSSGKREKSTHLFQWHFLDSIVQNLSSAFIMYG